MLRFTTGLLTAKDGSNRDTRCGQFHFKVGRTVTWMAIAQKVLVLYPEQKPTSLDAIVMDAVDTALAVVQER